MVRFIKAIRIGSNVTDIMKLPCVTACLKVEDKNGYPSLMYKVRIGRQTTLAEEGD